MKKLISLLVIAILSITTTLNVSAFGTYADNTHLYINGEHIITGKQIYIKGEKDNTIFFYIRNVLSDGKNEYKYYNYTNGKLIEIEEFDDYKTDFSDSESWTISKHYKSEYNSENNTMKIVVDGKTYGPFDCSFKSLDIGNISNNAFYYMYSGFMFTDINKEYTEKSGDDYYKLYFYPETKIKPIPSIDKLLNKVFIKIDKKGEHKSKKVYESLINRIDTLLNKTTSKKKKDLLEYIKYKVEEKLD